MDGWIGGWVDGWVGGKAGLRIAYSNQKSQSFIFCAKKVGWMDGWKGGWVEGW